MIFFLKIDFLKAKKIFDSSGKTKTIKLEIGAREKRVNVSVPSGKSKGRYEAVSVSSQRAVKIINKTLLAKIKNRLFTNQEDFDNFFIKLDGTKNKKKLGANTILVLSVGVSRLFAEFQKLFLWQYISKISKTKPKMPKPCVLVIEGGLHGKTKMEIQEFMIIPQNKSFKENFLEGKNIYFNLKKILKNKFGKKGIVLGEEGAFTPPIFDPQKVLDLIMLSARGHNLKIGLDCAATHFKKKKYSLDFYKNLAKKYPIIFFEDPFSENDFENFSKIKKEIGKKVFIVGDDLLTTNIERIKIAKKKNACNGVIIKPNQIGTITETIKAAKLAKQFGWKIIVSHRSKETNDDFISDLAVGLGADFIKAGGPTQKERFVKYKRLIEIEKEMEKIKN